MHKFSLFLTLLFNTFVLIPVAQAQYTESFESFSLPNGWVSEGTYPDPSIMWASGEEFSINPNHTAHTGNKMAYLNTSTLDAGSKSILVSPNINLSTNAGATIDFWLYRDTNSILRNGGSTFNLKDDTLNIWINTTPNAVGTSKVLLGTLYRYAGYVPVVATQGWYKYTYNLPLSFNGLTNYIIFEGKGAFGMDISIDDVTLPVTCTTLPNAGAVTVTPASVFFGDPVNGTVVGAGGNVEWIGSLDNVNYAPLGVSGNNWSQAIVTGISGDTLPTRVVYVRSVLSYPGCPSDSSNVASFTVIRREGDIKSTAITAGTNPSNYTTTFTLANYQDNLYNPLLESPEIFHKLILTECRWVQISTCNSGIDVDSAAMDSYVSVYNSAMQLVNSPEYDDDACVTSGYAPAVSYLLLPAGTYYIVSEAWAAPVAGNNITLEIQTWQATYSITTPNPAIVNTPLSVTANWPSSFPNNRRKYEWIKDGIVVSNSSVPTYIATQIGNYTFIPTMYDTIFTQSCLSNQVSVIIASSAIKELSTNAYTVYPNPSTGLFSVQFSGNNWDNVSYNVSDIIGNNLITNKITNSTINIDLSTYAKGIYYLKITNAGTVSIHKLVVE